MAWIESHQSLAQHPKTKKLARLLGIALPTAIGHLHLLWWWALDYAEDGDLSRYEDADIADACLWSGDAAEFVEKLAAAEFVNSDKRIHDWYEYAGKLIEKRKSDAKRKRATRLPQEDRQTSNGIPLDNQQTSAGQAKELRGTAQVPNRTVPTKPNNTPPTPPEGDDQFDAFWAEYPRKIGKTAAQQKWTAARKKVSADQLTVAAKNYASYCRSRASPVDKILHPSTFLGPSCRYEDYLSGLPQEVGEQLQPRFLEFDNTPVYGQDGKPIDYAALERGI